MRETKPAKWTFLRYAWKPEGSSLAPYNEGILDTLSSLAPFRLHQLDINDTFFM